MTKENDKYHQQEVQDQEESPDYNTFKKNMGFEFLLGFALGLALIVVLLWKVPQFIFVFAVGGLLFFGLIWLLFKYLV